MRSRARWAGGVVLAVGISVLVSACTSSATPSPSHSLPAWQRDLLALGLESPQAPFPSGVFTVPRTGYAVTASCGSASRGQAVYRLHDLQSGVEAAIPVRCDARRTAATADAALLPGETGHEIEVTVDPDARLRSFDLLVQRG